ncbi:hypothetical protein M011DRAFT_27519 [Sporormia fimetaria CBS 119925]|uniref:Uncharacterized protein n=1 Tax=Sporormia fimetaria CBS 119925 TaxID=1340428 RepID=A0A6A6VEM2_9PLEO|nr:hypothetical protein M011DRAFT_27519 [Sporormia fimetaria CBS 119925]
MRQVEVMGFRAGQPRRLDGLFPRATAPMSGSRGRSEVPGCTWCNWYPWAYCTQFQGSSCCAGLAIWTSVYCLACLATRHQSRNRTYLLPRQAPSAGERTQVAPSAAAHRAPGVAES